MKKRLGWILALTLGGAALYGLYINNNSTDAASGYQQQQTAPATTPSTTPTPSSTQQAQPSAPASQPVLSNDSHYTNVDGKVVHSPAKSSAGIPAGATAVCGDGSYSFSQHRQGTCSHHGGVARWL